MSMLAAIHVGKRELGLDEETYRAMLCRVTGKSSAKEMSEGERAAVVREMRRQGFKFLSGGNKGGSSRAKKQRSAFYKKCQALWIAGWNLGVVRDRTDRRLDVFIASRCGGVEVQAVEALKGWLERETPVDWEHKHYHCDEERIAAAQWLVLCDMSGEVYRPGGFMAAIQSIVGRSRGEMRSQDWHDVMNELGGRVRHLRDVRRKVVSDSARGVEGRSPDRECKND